MDVRESNGKRVCLRSRSSLVRKDSGQCLMLLHMNAPSVSCSWPKWPRCPIVPSVILWALAISLPPPWYSSSRCQCLSMCLPCPGSLFCSSSSQRSSIFHSHTRTEISLQALSLEIWPYCCFWCTWSPLLLLAAWEIKTGIKRWENRAPIRVGGKGGPSLSMWRPPLQQCPFSFRHLGSGSCPESI